VRETSSLNFGLIIAYLVPGFVALWGASYHSPTVRAWLAADPHNAPGVGGLLYATIGAIAVGVILSAFRWALIEPLHHRMGVTPPDWDFSLLDSRLSAYQAMVEQHFRYHQFCADMFLALVLAHAARMAAYAAGSYPWGWLDIAVPLVTVVLFFGSRDALAKYYARAGAILTSRPTNPREDRHERGPQASPARAERRGGEAGGCCKASQQPSVEARRGDAADQVVQAG